MSENRNRLIYFFTGIILLTALAATLLCLASFSADINASSAEVQRKRDNSYKSDTVSSAVQGEAIRISFSYGKKTWEYNDSGIYGGNDADTVHELTRRGYFLPRHKKLEKIEEIVSLGFTKRQAGDLVLTGLDEVTERIFKDINRAATDSAVTFHPERKQPFDISQEKNGFRVDENGLYELIFDGLTESGEFNVNIPVDTLRPVVTKQINESNTSLKSSFNTGYSSSTQSRKNNIRLSLLKFNGLRIKAGEEVSFNKIVGKRTAENGFQESKIIVNGKYEDGIGGGVCQSSTTLYNAAILAGLHIKEWHRHSLPCTYVPPSFDAMVSSASDMVFVNNTSHDIFIQTSADGNQAKVNIYGEPNKYKIVRESETIKTVDAEVKVIHDIDGNYADKVHYDDETFYITRPINGLTSKGYLNYYKDGKLAERKQIRTDTYKSQQGVMVKGTHPRPLPSTEENPLQEDGGNI